jgi:phage tail-like protein
MPVPTISERTRLTADPIRNFKFHVQITSLDPVADNEVARMGFTAVDGLSMNTEVMAYREGGWNTNPHKLPGQTDFTPISLSSGVFTTKPGMWNMAKKLFSAQWGQGTLSGLGSAGGPSEFRFDMMISVLDHPVTKGGVTGSPKHADPGTYAIRFKVYNAFVASVGFGGLNASDNSILVHSMTVHHEGFDVEFRGGNGLSTPYGVRNGRPGTIPV